MSGGSPVPSSRLHRFVALSVASLLLVSVAVSPVAAGAGRASSSAGLAAVRATPASLALPRHIALPDGFAPEGIVSWGPWLFAGSVANGAIWRGNAITGHGAI